MTSYPRQENYTPSLLFLKDQSSNESRGIVKPRESVPILIIYGLNDSVVNQVIVPATYIVEIDAAVCYVLEKQGVTMAAWEGP